MSSNKQSSGKQSFWARMNQKSRMYFVLALCAVALLLTALVALGILGFFTGGGKTPGAATPESAAMVTESGYNKDQNAIDKTAYTSTILEESADAGQTYIDETLFVGDSNTARMYRGGLQGNYATYANAIGSVGMAASSLKDYACIRFDDSSKFRTMPEAVALMQPKRVILTFGTNDLSPTRSTDTFIASYEEGIKAIVAAYPSVDIIVNSIPPLGKEHSNAQLTQSQADEYNKGLVQMCQTNGWKFLDSAEALKDDATGYAKAENVISADGIHLSETGMQALFTYIRTHSYITEDDRPTLTAIPTHVDDKDVAVYTVPVVATSSPSSQPQATEAPESDANSDPNISSPSSESTSYTYWTEVIAPTCTEQGYTIYHCNEDSGKDYQDNYTAVDPNNHAPVTQADGSVVCGRCGAVLQAAPAATQAPTAAPPAATDAPSTPTEPTAPPTEPTAAPPADSIVSGDGVITG